MDQTMDRNMSKANDKLNAAGRDVKNVISDSLRHMEVPTVVTEQLQALKEQSQAVLDRTEELVKKHPFYFVFGAAAVGALVGSIVSTSISARHYKH